MAAAAQTAPKITQLLELDVSADVRTQRPSLQLQAYPNACVFTQADCDYLVDYCQGTLAQVNVTPYSNISPDEYVKRIYPLAQVLQLGFEALLEDYDRTADRAESDGQLLRRAQEKIAQLESAAAGGLSFAGGAGPGANAALQEKNMALREEVAHLKGERNRLEQEDAALREKFDELNAETASLRKELARAQDEAQSFRHDNFELQSQIRRLQDEKLRSSAASSHEALGAGARRNGVAERERELVAQMEQLEDSFQSQQLDLERKLDVVKTENLTLCMEIKDVGSQAQQAQRQVGRLEDDIAAKERTIEQQKDVEQRLRLELETQISLLRDFELRLTRQTEDSNREMETLRGALEDATATRTRRPAPGAAGGAGDAAYLDSLEDQLAEAESALATLSGEKIQLLEAYELLEEDTGRMIDDAVAQQQRKVAEQSLRIEMKDKEIEALVAETKIQERMMRELESELEEASTDLARVTESEYHLPEALEEIKAIRAQLKNVNKAREALIVERNEFEERCEFFAEDNRQLRAAANLPVEAETLEDWRRRRTSKIAQLEALNAELERMVSDLEEERRTMRESRKICARYHGKQALDLGLRPEQALQLEAFMTKLRSGADVTVTGESKIVADLRGRIKILEDRLAKALAFSNLPRHIRDELEPGEQDRERSQEAEVVSLQQLALRNAGAALHQLSQALLSSLEQANTALSIPGHAPVQPQLAEVAAVTGRCRPLANQIAEGVPMSQLVVDAGFQAMVSQPLAQPQSMAGATTSSMTVAPAPPSPAVAAPAPLYSSSYLANASAEKLREALTATMKQLTTFEIAVASKDQEMKRLNALYQQAASRMGSALNDSERSGFLTPDEAAELQRQNHAFMEELVEALEEIAVLRRALDSTAADAARHAESAQAMVDQRNLLYRDYAAQILAHRHDAAQLKKLNLKLKTEAHEASTKVEALEKELAGLKLAPDVSKAVTEKIILSVRLERTLKELDRERESAKSALRLKDDLAWEMRELSSTARARIRWLSLSNDDLERRIASYGQKLLEAIPARAYHALLDKYTALVAHRRQAAEDSNAALLDAEHLKSGCDRRLAELEQRYCAVNERAAVAEEMWRQLHAKLTSPIDINQQLSGELKARSVELANAVARAEGAERRSQRSEEDVAEIHGQLSSVREEFARQAKQLQIVQLEAQELRTTLQSATSAAEAEALRAAAATADERAARLARDLADLEGASLDAADVKAHYETERKDLLIKLSLAKEEELRLLREVQRLERVVAEGEPGRSSSATGLGIDAAASAGRPSNATGVLMAKDAELERLRNIIERLRQSESMGRMTQRRIEDERNELDGQIKAITLSLQDKTRLLAVKEDALLFSRNQNLRLEEQLRLTCAGRVEKWKAELWSLKLKYLSSTNRELTRAHTVITDRVLRLENDLQTAEAHVERHAMRQQLATLPAQDQYKHLTKVSEQLLDAKVKFNKRDRECMLYHEKNSFLERVNADLHSRLEAYETEELKQQAELERQRHEDEMRATQLADDVRMLQRELELHKTVPAPPNMRSTSSQQPTLGHSAPLPSAAAALAGQSDDGATQHTLQRATSLTQYRRLTLDADDIGTSERYIEEIRTLRDTCADLEMRVNEQSRGRDNIRDKYELLRKEHMDLLSRMAVYDEASRDGVGNGSAAATLAAKFAVAQATVKELREQLDAERQASHEVQEANEQRTKFDAKRISELEDRLADEERRRLERLRLADEGPGTSLDSVPYDVLESRVQQLESANAQLERELEDKTRDFQYQLAQLEKRLRDSDRELQAAKNDANRKASSFAASPAAQLEGKLREQLTKKDRLVRALRDAVKQLEAKLIESEQRNADATLQLSSWKEAEKLSASVAALQRDKASLTGELDAARRSLAEAKAQLAARDAEFDDLKNKFDAEVARVTGILEDLSATRRQLRAFQNMEASALHANTALSSQQDAERIRELTTRVGVLEAQNARLKTAVKREEAAKPSGTLFSIGADIPEESSATLAAGGSSRDPAGQSAAGSSSAGRGGGAARRSGGRQGSEVPELTQKLTMLRNDMKRKNQELEAKRDECGALKKRVQEAERREAETQGQLAKARKQLQAVQHEASLMPPLKADPAAVQLLTQELETANALVATLQAELRKFGPDASPTVEKGSLEEALFDARAAHEAAERRVARLELRLADLFGATLLRSADSEAIRRGSSAAAVRARENELIATIQSLQRALEAKQREFAAMIPASKHMKEVNAHKATKKELADVRKGLEQAAPKADSDDKTARLEQQIAKLRSANASLKATLERMESEPQAAPIGETPGTSAEQALRQELALRDAAARKLERALTEKDRALQNALRKAEQSEPAASSTADLELKAVRKQLAQALQENEAAKRELSDLADPLFWEEIEDLKYERQQLGQSVEEYVRIIRSLANQLGIVPPV